MKAQNAALNVLLTGQAYLWADWQRFKAEARGDTVTDEQFGSWMEEWRKEAQAEIAHLVSEEYKDAE